MEESVYVGSLTASLVYLALGTRLLCTRNKSAIEWLLGLTFLAWMLSFAPWVFAYAFQDEPALETQILIASQIATNLGNIGFAFFPLLAFRRGSAWAKKLSFGIAISLMVGAVGSVWVGDPEGVEPFTNIWWWFVWVGEIAPAIWIGAEGLHHYGTSSQRVRVGLCEPIVRHQFLLWGIAGVFWTLLDFVVIGQYVEFWVTNSWSVKLDNLAGFCEIAALAMIWLAFFPPAAYERRINSSAVSA